MLYLSINLLMDRDGERLFVQNLSLSDNALIPVLL